MGKVVKAVVGVAVTVVGVVTNNPLLIAQGASMTLGAVLSKSPKGNSATNQRLNKQLAPEDFRKIVFGRTAGAADLRFWEVHGSKNTTYSEVIAVAGHRIHSFQEFYAEEEVVGFSGTAAIGTYSGVLTRRLNNGAPGNAALTVGSGTYWTASSKFTGVAHYALTWEYNEKKLPNGIPQKITQVIEGALVYDPRRDSTRGGSGSHRIDDQSTWSYATLDGNGQPIGRNNALQALWYLVGWRVQNPSTGEWVLMAGQGIDLVDIDVASFIAAANDAEAQQFYTDMVLSTGDSHATNRSVISCGDTIGRFLDPGGLWTYRVTKDDTSVPAVALTEDDILEGSVEWVPDKPMSEQYNRVVGTYVDPSATSLFQAKAYPQVKNTTYEADDGFKKRKTLNFQAIQDEVLAQKAARIVLNEGRYVGEFRATFGFRALQAQIWDVVGLTLDRYGFDSSYRFRVRSQSLSATGIEMLIRITHASVYAGGTVTISPAPSTLAKYDPRQQVAVEGLSVTQATLSGAGGTAQDAVAISWTAAPGNVRRTEGQFKLTSATLWTTAFASQSDDLNTCIAGPLLPSSSYQVRVRHVSIHEIPGPWSNVSVMTGANGRVTSAQVTYADGTLIEALKPAEAGATLGARAGTNLVDSGGASLNDNAIKNLAISIGASGALAGAGGGQVTISGLGYAGDLNATSGDNMIRNAALAANSNDWVVTLGTAARTTSATAGDQPAFMRATAATNLVALNGGGTGTSAIPIRPGTRLFYSWLARADIVNSGSGNDRRRCYLRQTFYTASGSGILTIDVYDEGKAATAVEAGGCGTAWELHRAYYDAPANAAFVKLELFPLLGSTGAGKYIDVTKVALAMSQAGADKTVDQLLLAQVQPRSTVGDNLCRNGDFSNGADGWWLKATGGWATSELAWRSGAAEGLPGWLRHTPTGFNINRATYHPTRYDRSNPFHPEDGMPVTAGREVYLQFGYRSDGNMTFGVDAWFYTSSGTQIAGAQPFAGGPFSGGIATFVADTAGSVVRSAIAKIAVPAGANIMFLRVTMGRPTGSSATYGEVGLFGLTAAEPGATLGARAGTNLVDSSGAALGDGAIKNLAISIGANGALSGAGGGQVTIGGLGYGGALDATRNSVTYSASAPTSPTPINGDIWVDISAATPVVKLRANGGWQEGIQAGADITSLAQVVVSPPPAQTINRDWQGLAKDGQLPRTITPSVTRGGVSIRTDNATSHSITTTGVTATVNNTNGSADKGRITITAGGPGSISLTVTRDGVAYGPFVIAVAIEDDAPPNNQGSGGGSDSTLESVNSTSFVQMTSVGSGEAIFTATITAGQSLVGTAPLVYNWTLNSGGGSNKLLAKWQYKPSGGSWTDFAAAITGSAAIWIAADFSGEPGSGNFNQTKSGLTAGTYEVRLVGAKETSSGNAITIASGTATLSVA